MKTSFSAIVASNRAEIVEQLRSLADALEGDEPVEMDLNGMELEFDLPEDAECGFELELDSEGECELELEISWNAKVRVSPVDGDAAPLEDADEVEDADEAEDTGAATADEETAEAKTNKSK